MNENKYDYLKSYGLEGESFKAVVAKLEAMDARMERCFDEALKNCKHIRDENLRRENAQHLLRQIEQTKVRRYSR